MPYDKPEEMGEDFKAGVRRNARKLWEDSPAKAGLDTVGRWFDQGGALAEAAYQRLLQSVRPTPPPGDIYLPPEISPVVKRYMQREGARENERRFIEASGLADTTGKDRYQQLVQEQLLQQMAAKKPRRSSEAD